MNVLITGGVGFLGSHIAMALANRGDRVTVFDNIASANPWGIDKLNGKALLVDGDILNQEYLEEVLVKEKIDKVVHAAAIVGARTALGIEKKVAEVNVLGTICVLEAVRKTGVKKYVDITSEEVYGEFLSEPAGEDHRAKPLSPYGITKYTAEAFSDYYAKFYELNTVSVRTSWVFGPGYPRERMPLDMIKSALSDKKIEMSSGAAMRIDYIYVDDFVQGVLLVLDDDLLPHRLYNIASGKAYTVVEVAEMIKEFLPDITFSIGPGVVRTKENLLMPQKGALDITRAKTELGYQPQYSLKDGIKLYIEYLQKNDY